MENTTTTEVVKFDKLATSAPQILEENQSSVLKATQATNKLLDIIETSGMNDEVDGYANNLIVKLRTTQKSMNEKRSWITQTFDTIRKQFTGAENEVKALADTLQGHRNTYAQEKLEKQRAEEAKAKLEKEKKDEVINFKTACAYACNDRYAAIILQKKQNLQRIYDSLSLENFGDFRKRIANFPQEFPLADYKVEVTFSTKHMSVEDRNLFLEEAKKEHLPRYQAEFKTAINNHVADLVSKLQSKLTELQQIAEAEKANAKEAARLKAEAEKRKAEEKKRLEEEAKANKEKADAEATVKAKEAEMQNLFDATPATKQVERTGYEIIVKHPNAWPLMIQLWFEHEGKELALDQMEKKTFKQVKTFCEKLAHKQDIKIDSKYLDYKEEVKTRAA